MWIDAHSDGRDSDADSMDDDSVKWLRFELLPAACCIAAASAVNSIPTFTMTVPALAEGVVAMEQAQVRLQQATQCRRAQYQDSFRSLRGQYPNASSTITCWSCSCSMIETSGRYIYIPTILFIYMTADIYIYSQIYKYKGIYIYLPSYLYT